MIHNQSCNFIDPYHILVIGPKNLTCMIHQTDSYQEANVIWTHDQPLPTWERELYMDIFYTLNAFADKKHYY